MKEAPPSLRAAGPFVAISLGRQISPPITVVIRPSSAPSPPPLPLESSRWATAPTRFPSRSRTGGTRGASDAGCEDVPRAQVAR
jgi:hypothetical protein